MSTSAQQEAITPTKAGSGDFVWHELRTTNPQAAEEFYTHVVGWTTKDSGSPGGAPYTLFSVGDLSAAGMMHLTPEMIEGGVGPGWVGFIGVDNVDATAAKVEKAGGKLHCPPQDIPTIGRFASVEDPQGAVFLLFKGSLDYAPPRPPVGSPGTVGWNELSANDEKTAWPFYSDIFGWKEDRTMDMGANGIYRIFNNGGPAIGGMMTRDPKAAPTAFWLYYFNVEDIDAAAARIKEKRGTLLMEPHSIPGDLWIVLALDPQGLLFSLVGRKAQ